jgi:hypothetical protein
MGKKKGVFIGKIEGFMGKMEGIICKMEGFIGKMGWRFL